MREYVCVLQVCGERGEERLDGWDGRFGTGTVRGGKGDDREQLV